MKQLFFALSGLVLAALACSLPGVSAPPVDVPAPPPTETNVVPLPATETPPAPTSIPAAPGGFLPSGFAATDGDSSIFFYGPDGSLTNTLVVGKGNYFNRFAVHVAGGTSAGMPPVNYFLWRDSESLIFENRSGVETRLMSQPDFFRMAGAPASPYFAYSTATYSDAGLITRLYLGTSASIASAAPVLDLVDSNGLALKPLAFRMEGGAPTGIYYTACMFGIGGDIVFDPCMRLALLDLATGLSTEILSADFNPASISPDGVWVGYAGSGGGQPVRFLNLVTGESNSFPALASNDRGSGDVVFSPDSRYLAWMEASGYRMDEPITFQTSLRIGTTAGADVALYEGEIFGKATGFPVGLASPVGWLDNDSLLVQAVSVDGLLTALVRLDMDGNLTYLASGYFLALTYP